MEPKIINIKKIVGEGILSIIDKQNNLPFEIKRIFYVYDIPNNTRRGGHAHKVLKQFIWFKKNSKLFQFMPLSKIFIYNEVILAYNREMGREI